MIKSISIKGFQSHIDTELQFADGLTVITGTSGHGKTAIIRAIRWICLGEPLGDSFVNEKAKECKVTLELHNGYKIVKTRKGTATVYRVVCPDGTLQEYQMARVPDEVFALTGISTHNLGEFETSLNFAFQMDAPFLLSESPSAGAKVLGALAKVDDVDGALQDATGETYRLRSKRKVASERIDELNEELKQFEGLNELEQVLLQVENRFSSLQESQTRQAKLVNLVDNLAKTRYAVRQVEERLLSLVSVPVLREGIDNVVEAYDRREMLYQFTKKLSQYQTAICNLESKLTHLQGVGLLRERIDKVESDLIRLQGLQKIAGTYKEVVVRRGELERRLGLLTALPDLGQIENSYVRLSRLTTLKDNYYRVQTDVLRAVGVHGSKEYDLCLLQKEYQDFWDGLEVCPLSGEHICKLYKEV